MRVTIKDCRVQTFRAGGSGGQNQNVRDTGVRIIHAPSGAVGEARDSRHQKQNKRSAFRRMAESKEFQTWARRQLLPDDLPQAQSFERIRTYNLVKRFAKDHRSGKTTTEIKRLMDGDLDLLR
jgi:protein subunit release factor A